jgi:hypothetical protein
LHKRKDFKESFTLKERMGGSFNLYEQAGYEFFRLSVIALQQSDQTRDWSGE